MSPASTVCGLSLKANMPETPHSTRRSGTHFVYICFHVCGRKNPNTPNSNSLADDVRTWGGIEVWDLQSKSMASTHRKIIW